MTLKIIAAALTHEVTAMSLYSAIVKNYEALKRGRSYVPVDDLKKKCEEDTKKKLSVQDLLNCIKAYRLELNLDRGI